MKALPFWDYQALNRSHNIVEQYAKCITNSINTDGDLQKFPGVVAEKKIQWWTKKFFCGSKKQFQKYLSCLGVDQEAWFSSSNYKSACNCELASAWRPHENKANINVLEHRKPRRESSAPIFGFASLCFSIIDDSLDLMHLALENASSKKTLNKSKLLLDFELYIRQRISFFATPSLILEANIFRIKGAGSSDSPEERFNEFLESLKLEVNQKRFWNKYPVLWRLISSIVVSSTKACIQTIERVCTNGKTIADTFGIDPAEALQSIHWGSGDSHRGGQVVAILYFEKNKLVYKPRSQKIDVFFNEFLDWYATVATKGAPESYKVLDCGDYGFTAFITAEPATSKDEFASFYTKIGSLIAISWLLGIQDLHHENLIAGQANPYLIDVEAMFDRPLRHRKIRLSYEDMSAKAFKELVFGTGLIPFRMLGSSGVFDLSAIGARGEQPTPTDVLKLENFGRDDVKIVSKPDVMPQANNVLTLNGYEYRLNDFSHEILVGYDNAIQKFKEYRSVLLSNDGIVKKIHNAPVRWIARQTRDYVQLMEKMAHPSALVDALECDMVIGGDLWNTVRFAPHLEELVSSEYKDLWRGDVPYFWTTPGARELHSSDGKVFANFFHTDGIYEFNQRLHSLDEHKEARFHAIRSSLKSTVPLELEVYPGGLSESRYNSKLPPPSDLVNIAAQIGNEIIRTLHYVDGVPFGIGLAPLEEKHYSAGILPPDLYDGLSGVGIFFAYLSKFSEDKIFRKVAKDIHRLNRLLIRHKAGIPSCGAFTGIAGLIFAEMHLAPLLDKPISRDCRRSFPLLKRLIKIDNNFDIISGSAGALLVMLRYYIQTGDAEALKVAEMAAERLAVKAEPQKSGIAWHTMKTHEQRLGGLSHGVTGIAWALCEWAEHTKTTKWKTLARQAFDYEQSLYDADLATWLDLRHESPTCFWCYGAPGIGLGVNNMHNVLNKLVCEDVIRKAKEATWKYGFTNSHCLCHGDLGNAELYLATNEHGKATLILNNVLADYEKNGIWRCGLPDNATTPGFMCGLAGIGYSMLRHAYVNLVPNILNLEIPKWG